jgi:hypothetical protein
MSSNFGKWRFEKKPLLISLMFGAISLFLLLMISNLEFVKESSRTFEGTDGLFWTLVIAAGMGLACYAVMLSVEDYLSNCSNKTDRKEFIRKMLVRYFLPLILIIIVAFVVCGMYGVNIFGELVIIGMIYFVITFPRFVNRYLPRE